MSVAPAIARDPRAAWPGRLPGAAVLAGLTALAYHRVATTLWTTWTTNENYSHGPLVPLVAAALVWHGRARLRAAPVHGDARGIALVALACLLLVAGVRTDVFALQGWSLLPLLFGISLTFLGGPVTRVLAFPLAYLAFMLTFPPVVMGQLSYALKEVTVALSTRAAEALGAVVQRDGMILVLPTGALGIENPCSGLRSLVALLATGALFGWLQPGGTWRRIALVAAAVPIAMVGNAVRITLVILVAHYRDVPTASGAFHDRSGVLIYAVALAALAGLRALLTPRAPRAGAA
jgi:exosortase